jgi:hypothetical protein
MAYERTLKESPQPEVADRPTPLLPWRRTVGVALLVGWFPVAIGEGLYGTMDDFSQLDLVAAAPGRMVAGGLIQLLGAILLIPAIVGMLHLARSSSRWLVAPAAVLTLGLPVALGAFAQLHLVAREFARPEVDRSLMSGFVVARFNDAVGPWGVPVMLVLAGMTLGLPLLLAALWRARAVSIVPFSVALVHLPLHFIETSWSEVASHVVLAFAVALVGMRVLRMSDTDWSDASFHRR